MAEAAHHDLEGVLGELKKAAESNGAKVSVGEIVEAFGHRSFGPLLLLTGLLGMTPVSAVPTAPTALALIAILIAGQLLFGRKTIWLPRVLETMSVKAARVDQAVCAARKPARIADRVTKPRLAALTGPLADRLVALAIVVIAACVPPLELLPFVAFVPALAIAVFGLALTTRDGLLTLIALTLSAGAVAFGAWKLLS